VAELQAVVVADVVVVLAVEIVAKMDFGRRDGYASENVIQVHMGCGTGKAQVVVGDGDD